MPGIDSGPSSPSLLDLMKHKPIQSPGLGLLAALLVSTGAWASGNHADGHGHDPCQRRDLHGKPGIAARARRTIEVVMSDDMRFSPSNIEVRRGETVRLRVRNAGQLRHEFSLGTRQELEEHYEQMKQFPDMVHDEPNKIRWSPGNRARSSGSSAAAASWDFACLQVGHYEAGMKGQVKVGR